MGPPSCEVFVHNALPAEPMPGIVANSTFARVCLVVGKLQEWDRAFDSAITANFLPLCRVVAARKACYVTRLGEESERPA